MSRYRLGVDIGGTFTDAALVDEETGALSIYKVLTTPGNPADGFMETLTQAARKEGLRPEALTLISHATTIATNALIEGNRTRVGMLITEGFRDILEIGYQIRPLLYDMFQKKPAPLVERQWSFGVRERLDAHGQVLIPLDERGVRQAVARMKAGGMEAVVICFLHSYLNPVHERRAAAIVRKEFPQAQVSVSSEVCPEFREFPRASTAAVNAAVMPVVARYLDDLERRLTGQRVQAPFYVMQSNGGMMSASVARTRPVYMVESGPAAGVIMAAALARARGYARAISFDMGGTTAKVGLIQDGMPRLSNEYEVGSHAVTPMGEGKGSGYPVRTQVIDLVEVGAGGGSLAWLDAGGSLRVGPRSAGADPGPACYGRGGTEPTLTDVNLVLGRLDPAFFLGGEHPLNLLAAREALRQRIAQPLALNVESAAAGVVEIANAGMMAAMRLVSVQRGFDPRDFVLVAFGGAGPLHANALAREMDIPTVLVPRSPGVASAVGLLMTDIKHEFQATRRRLLGETEAAEMAERFAEFEHQADRLLSAERSHWSAVSLVRTLDLRYRGQSHELQVVLPPGPVNAASLTQASARFEAAHKQAYGYTADGDPIELVNLRLTAVGQVAPVKRPPMVLGKGAQGALKSHRPVWFSGLQPTEAAVYDRYRLGAGDVLKGPAVVEEMDASTLVLPEWQARVDDQGNLILTTI
ncbi:MAG: hydantoinase/oxoprolinase family protein [Deltaproteobacteria bacterium]|nr:hydantoinase/oxoprolinase family protein [Deltaproteobacteria bacterium]